jgi:predicted nucleic acid-binding protein
VALNVFLDTSVLLAGLIDFGPQSGPAQTIMHAVAEKRITAPGTAWHCCLELFSVATRLPPEFRLSAANVVQLVEEEIFARMAVHDLPSGDRSVLLRAAAQDGIAGGRIYDAHIAEVARAAGAAVIVTDNRRHFLAALRHGLRVDTPQEFLEGLKSKPARPADR